MQNKASITVGELKIILANLDVSDDSEIYWHVDGHDVFGSISANTEIHNHGAIKTVSILIDND